MSPNDPKRDPTIVVSDVASLVKAEKQGDTEAKKKLDSLLEEAEIIFGFNPLRFF